MSREEATIQSTVNMVIDDLTYDDQLTDLINGLAGEYTHDLVFSLEDWEVVEILSADAKLTESLVRQALGSSLSSDNIYMAICNKVLTLVIAKFKIGGESK